MCKTCKAHNPGKDKKAAPAKKAAATKKAAGKTTKKK